MSFLTPARATASPMSVHTAVSVLVLSEMVPQLGPGIHVSPPRRYLIRTPFFMTTKFYNTCECSKRIGSLRKSESSVTSYDDKGEPSIDITYSPVGSLLELNGIR